MNHATIMVTCAGGVAPMLAAELAGLGLEPTIDSPSAVRTHGDAEAVMRICLASRTAHRVLWMIREQAVANPDVLYERTHHLPWEEWIDASIPLTITTSGFFRGAKDPRFAALKVKDAVVDRLREKTGRRPDTGPERDGNVVHIHGDGKQVAWYFDAAGTPLAYRGYRKKTGPAPMRESLAAACLIRCGWTGDTALINPMCGSGTLAIEAAWIAGGIEPGLMRTDFAFLRGRWLDRARWEELRAEASARRLDRPRARILASDHDARAVEAARENAAAAGVEDWIEWSVSDFRKTGIPPGPGLILINPEYGVRMVANPELDRQYEQIGKDWKTRARGRTAALFCGNAARAARLGLTPVRETALFNGNLECRLFEYRL